MRVHIKRTLGEGVTFQIDSGGRTDGGYQWGLPARVYRYAARTVIEALLAENQALRHNKQATMPAHLILVPHPRFLRMVETVLMRLGKEE